MPERKLELMVRLIIHVTGGGASDYEILEQEDFALGPQAILSGTRDFLSDILSNEDMNALLESDEPRVEGDVIEVYGTLEQHVETNFSLDCGVETEVYLRWKTNPSVSKFPPEVAAQYLADMFPPDAPSFD